MQLLKSFLQVVRAPNLLFIILTQLLFQYCIYCPIYGHAVPPGDYFRFAMWVAASVCIAAAGYIINDYFDVNIDLINKPQKVIIGKKIRRRSAQLWHLGLNAAGIMFTACGLWYGHNGYLLFANIASIVLLWLYSASFKKKLLIGNVAISLLTAWSILVIFLSKHALSDAFGGDALQLKFFRFAMLYSGFAFIISLIREAVKDIEDMPGDAKFGCTTMPLLWGVTATKVYIAVWLTILLTMVFIAQVYIAQLGWWAEVVYAMLCILLPMVLLYKKIISAKYTADYAYCSRLAKLIMLSGIVSMVFFYFYL